MIDTKLLRQKILDLAIRGKLVPQNPADESASELLKKIKAEKDALVKAGKIKKDKHESCIFKGDDNRYYETIDGKTADITDEIPFDLPDSWTWCRFSTATINRDGERIPLSQKTREKLEKKYDYYGASGVIDKVDKYLFNERLLLIGEDGANLITRSKPIAFIANGLYWVNNHAHVLQTPTAVLLDYLCCFINAIPLDKYVTGSAQPKMTQDKMNTILIPLPPLVEQQRIVAQIETLLGYVDIIDTDAETLEKSITLAKQKILDLAIRGKLVPQDPADEPASELLKKIKAEKDVLVKAGKIKKDKHESYIFKSDDNCYYEQLNGKTVDITAEVPFDLPDTWEWCRLATLCDYGVCQSADPQEIPSDAWILDLEDIEKDSGKLLQRVFKKQRPPTSSKHRFVKSNVLYSKLRTYLNKVLVADIDGFCTSEILPLDFGNNVHSDYARHVLMSKMFLDYTAQCGYGVKMPRLGTNDGRKALFPLPPLNEQKRIVFSIKQYEAILKVLRE